MGGTRVSKAGLILAYDQDWLQFHKSCGLYYKHVTIVNYASSNINKLKASHNDDARVLIYDRHMFIVQWPVL
jgi:hypothetical protein